jgi:hypothetical protein
VHAGTGDPSRDVAQRPQIGDIDRRQDVDAGGQQFGHVFVPLPPVGTRVREFVEEHLIGSSFEHPCYTDLVEDRTRGTSACAAARVEPERLVPGGHAPVTLDPAEHRSSFAWARRRPSLSIR